MRAARRVEGQLSRVRARWVSEGPRNVAASLGLFSQHLFMAAILQVKRAADPQNMTRITPLRMFACLTTHGFSLGQDELCLPVLSFDWPVGGSATDCKNI